jgi:hypothetical protein
MFAIFNGSRRSLAQDPERSAFIQVDVQFLPYLHMFKGAELAVLMALALRMNEDGWCWPSIETLEKDTGYTRITIFKALESLTKKKVKGRRVLLRARLRSPDGTFSTNCYLLFPSEEEVAEYDEKELPAPPSTKYKKVILGGGEPSITFSNLEKVNPNNNHSTRNNNHKEEEGGEGKEKDPQVGRKEEIAERLEELGVFPEQAKEIAEKMAEAGLSAEEAEEIFLRTLKSVQAGKPRKEEEVVAIAVQRLRRGQWDGGEKGRRALRKAQGLAIPQPPPPHGEEGEQEDDLEMLWKKALVELEGKVPKATFSAHFPQTHLLELQDGKAIIAVPNLATKAWLEEKFAHLVHKVLAAVLGKEIEVNFVCHGGV